MESATPDSDPGTFTRELAALVESAGVAVALIGGAAVNTYVEPRYTKDIDLTVAADRDGIVALTALLHEAGFVTVRDQDNHESSGPDFVQLTRDSTHDIVDLIAAKTPFQRSVIERAIRVVGQWLPVATPEDLLVLKLIANRSRDRIDAESLARTQPINWAYVQEWAAVWGLEDSLRQLRAALPQ